MTMDEIIIAFAIILILDLWALIAIVSSAESSRVKAWWSLAVIGLPFIGFTAWLYKGPAPNPDL